VARSVVSAASRWPLVKSNETKRHRLGPGGVPDLGGSRLPTISSATEVREALGDKFPKHLSLDRLHRSHRALGA
jgi:hypothetical protein